MQNKPKYLLIGLLIAIVALIAWYLQTIVIYICVAIIISLIGQPLVRIYSSLKIKKIGLPGSVSALLALVTITLFIGIFVSLFIPLLVEEARIISNINPQQIITMFREPLANLNYDLQKLQIEYGHGESLENYLASQLTSFFGFQEVSSYAQGMVSFTASLIGGTLAILFMAFFFMKDEHLIYNTVLLLTPPKQLRAIKEIMKDTKRLLTKYFIGILLDMLFVALLTSIALYFLGVKNFLLIGMFAGLMNVIPYVGPLIGAAFGILIGVTSNPELEFYTQLLPLIYKIALTFLIIQLIDAFVFQPLVISNIVKAHPLEIFLVILIAGTLAGIGGMVIAVPVYTILRIVAKEFLNNFKIVQKLTAELDEEELE
ncbi:MAG TPA: AI-2E family transporter [Bacteroidia bacterium]|jgi:predicted PurR-regulated permease PerM